MSDLTQIDGPADVVAFVVELISSLPPRRDWPTQEDAIAWTEGPAPAEAHPEALTVDHHRTFSVAASETVWALEVEGSRTRRGRGGRVETLIEIRWVVALRYDAGPEDYRRVALAAEAEIVDAIRRYHEGRAAPIRLTPVRASRSTGTAAVAEAEGSDRLAWCVGVIQVQADHAYRGLTP